MTWYHRSVKMHFEQSRPLDVCLVNDNVRPRLRSSQIACHPLKGSPNCLAACLQQDKHPSLICAIEALRPFIHVFRDDYQLFGTSQHLIKNRDDLNFSSNTIDWDEHSESAFSWLSEDHSEVPRTFLRLLFCFCRPTSWELRQRNPWPGGVEGGLVSGWKCRKLSSETKSLQAVLWLFGLCWTDSCAAYVVFYQHFKVVILLLCADHAPALGQNHPIQKLEWSCQEM